MALSVLFLCDRNTVRSPIAAAMLARALPSAAIASAGIAADASIDPFAVAAMAEDGIDLSAHQPRSADWAAIAPGTLVIALSMGAFTAAKAHRNAGFELEFWDLPAVPSPDAPRDMVLEGYRAIREALRLHINNRFKP